jgi:bifunctional DNA-binding transcriptional regulator/antitoxin component of YhaV-PrlF toxin-antitoxin module
MKNTVIPTTFKIKISSKNQITLPVAMLKQMGWSAGQVFSFTKSGSTWNMKTTQDTLDEIHKIVSKYKLPDISVEDAIEYAHKQYEDQRYDYKD